MKKNNKKIVLSVIALAAILLQQNLYAGFFDQLSHDLQRSLMQPSKTQRAAVQPEPVKQEPQEVMVPVGSVSKAVNVRSGPGTSNEKVGRLTPDDSIRILATEGNWLQIEADSANGLVAGWVYKPLVTISSEQVAISSDATGSSVNASVGKTKNKQNVHYAGYSKEFQKVKQMMVSGNLAGIEQFFSDREAKILKGKTKWQAVNDIGLLRWMERGTLYLDSNKLDKSIKSFDNAENILKVRQKDSKTSDFLTSLTSFAAETVTGNEEFQNYPGEGYEKVLMLNYKSIAYLLDGKRQAYNVARRAIDWQNMEKAKFKDKVDKAKKETNKSKQEAKEQEASSSDWKSRYRKLDKIATKVPSAFVNPFGYYVTGMIQEFESVKDPSLKDNARIAYKKALELNPKSKVIQQALRDMKGKKSYRNKRLLHVVVGDGFVPEKKMLVYNFSTGKGGIVPIKLPIYEPVPSKVARIEVQTTGGKRLARLSPVADIEAISLRHQKDTEAFRTLRMTLAITRAIGVTQATQRLGVFGNILGAAVNDMAAPDMRSWMSLPATLQAARLHISKKTKKLKLVSFDARGRRLASRVIEISKQSDVFIYARSIDKQLYVNSSKTLWTAQ